MESDYSRIAEPQQDRQAKQERERTTERRERTDAPEAGLVHASQMLQSGAKLRELSPDDVQAVAAAVGNQTMLQLLHGGGTAPLAPAPPGQSEDTALPETEVDVRWPILCVPQNFARDGPARRNVFPIECLRPMGHYTGNGVIPDG